MLIEYKDVLDSSFLENTVTFLFREVIECCIAKCVKIVDVLEILVLYCYNKRKSEKMKYGRIICNYDIYAKSAVAGYNVGDGVQTNFVDYLYKQAGIDLDEVVIVDSCDLTTYSGEPLTVPIIGIPIGNLLGALPFSPNIKPIFFSSHINTSRFSEADFDYLRRYEPIGCRDEYTYKQMLENNIEAYISGCVTMALPVRKKNRNQNKIFFVDTPDSLDEYVPIDQIDKYEKISHLLPMEKHTMTHKDAIDFEQKSINLLERYQKEAGLVVSSRIHALAPCLAMGIPAIAVVENCSYRFSWIDKFIKIYTPDQLGSIDWKGVTIEADELRDNIIELFTKLIQEQPDDEKLMKRMTEFYLSREKAVYGSHYIRKLNELNPETMKNNYVIWGCGLIGESSYKAICDIFPDAHLAAAIDTHAEGTFHDVPIVKPDKLHEYDDCFIVVANYSGKDACLNTLKQMNKVDNIDYIFMGTQNG